MKKSHKHKIKQSLIRKCSILLVLVAILFASIFVVGRRMSPLLCELASQKARNVATMMISNTIYSEIENKGLEYGDLVTLDKDSSGRICALKTNIIKINSLKTYLTMAVSRELEKLQKVEVSIPIGNILEGVFLSGKGPEISIRLMQAGSVSTEVSNLFTDAGINQTSHKVMLDVNATIKVMVPFSSITEKISTSICIAETVIVGSVPEAYTKVEYAPESAVGDVMDFGAGANWEVGRGIYED